MDAEDLIKQAADRVRAALDAAQERADEIVREAEAEAQRIRAKAESEARERLDEVREALVPARGGSRRSLSRRQRPAPESAPKAPEAAEPEPRKSPEEPKVPEPQPRPAPEPVTQASNGRPTATTPERRGWWRRSWPWMAPRAPRRGTSSPPTTAVADLDALLDEVYAKAGR